MRAVRTLGFLALALVGLAFVAFGIDDVTMAQPPPSHQRYLDQVPGGVPDQVPPLLLSMFDGQGGLFLGSGLALLVLLAGPIRQRNLHAWLAGTFLAGLGNAGIVLGLVNAGLPYGIPLALLGLALAGAAALAPFPRARDTSPAA